MSPEAPQERLACGRLADDLLAQVADGRGDHRDEHQRNCPHCQATLAEYDRLWGPIQELGAEHITTPDGFLEQALQRIRGSVEHTYYGVLPSSAGLTRVSARVVMITARETAQAVHGVRVALGRHVAAALRTSTDSGSGRGEDAPVTGHGHPEVAVGVAGRSTAIEITLAADYGFDLQQLGEQVRDAVVSSVRALTGMEPVHVTVVIDDVFE